MPPELVGDECYLLSVVLLNRANNTKLFVRGPDPGIDQKSLVSGSTYWFKGDLVSVVCLPGQITYYVLKSRGITVLMSNLVLLILTGILACIITALGLASWLARRFRKRTIDALLREAVTNDSLFMHYQPVVDNRTNVIVSQKH